MVKLYEKLWNYFLSGSDVLIKNQRKLYILKDGKLVIYVNISYIRCSIYIETSFYNTIYDIAGGRRGDDDAHGSTQSIRNIIINLMIKSREYLDENLLNSYLNCDPIVPIVNMPPKWTLETVSHGVDEHDMVVFKIKNGVSGN